MKKNTIWLIMFALALLLTSHAVAEDASQEAFYRECIGAKIARLEQKAETLVNCQSTNLQECSTKAREQASFYQRNAESLIQQMVQADIPMKPYKVDYFLIKAYTESSNLARSN